MKRPPTVELSPARRGATLLLIQSFAKAISANILITGGGVKSMEVTV